MSIEELDILLWSSVENGLGNRSHQDRSELQPWRQPSALIIAALCFCAKSKQPGAILLPTDMVVLFSLGALHKLGWYQETAGLQKRKFKPKLNLTVLGDLLLTFLKQLRASHCEDKHL